MLVPQRKAKVKVAGRSSDGTMAVQLRQSVLRGMEDECDDVRRRVGRIGARSPHHYWAGYGDLLVGRRAFKLSQDRVACVAPGLHLVHARAAKAYQTDGRLCDITASYHGRRLAHDRSDVTLAVVTKPPGWA